MSRHCHVPEELKNQPFTLEQARTYGLTRDHLRGSAWRRVSRGWYRWAGCTPTEEVLLETIRRMVPPDSAFSGRTAARLLGLDVPAARKPEVIVQRPTGITERVEATVSRARLPSTEVVTRGGFRITSPVRTCFDLVRQLSLVEAVVVVDMALHAGLMELDEFRSYLEERAGAAGITAARHAVEFAEPKSESPQETRLRMLLVRGGLPRPEAQVSVHDAAGTFAGRLDLYYPDARLGIEYDGENHRDRLTDDNRRQNRLLKLGIRLLRYTGPDLRERPHVIVREVGTALRQTTAPMVHQRAL
ncbi:MAG: DUF559 domain-containing protein [Candidatus Dormibacteraeota bacterium]|nr:DUF559 domain-containing protein [Candidatus Dormibacteraeota bacterium]